MLSGLSCVCSGWGVAECWGACWDGPVLEHGPEVAFPPCLPMQTASSPASSLCRPTMHGRRGPGWWERSASMTATCRNCAGGWGMRLTRKPRGQQRTASGWCAACFELCRTVIDLEHAPWQSLSRLQSQSSLQVTNTTYLHQHATLGCCR
jgi:hypothetical protein